MAARLNCQGKIEIVLIPRGNYKAHRGTTVLFHMASE